MVESLEQDVLAQDIGRDTGLAALVTLLRFNGVAAEREAIRARFGKPGELFREGEILQAAQELGVDVQAVHTQLSDVSTHLLPAIVLLKNGSFKLLVSVKDDTVFIQDPISHDRETTTVTDFTGQWSGHLIRMAPKSGSETAGQSRFGWVWFVPAIYRYRKLFVQVLLAAFVLQLFALATPLAFQVVFDKVLVHGGLTTLDVMIIGLATVTLFEVLLGGLRMYVFSHTSARIDVELGARLFRHMLRLPVDYFGKNATGQTVARVRELDALREFLTGSALTLVVDLFFTFVFLAVMFHFSTLLGWVVAATLPLYIAISLISAPMLERRTQDKLKAGAASQAFLTESVGGIETIKSMAVEKRIERQWEDKLAANARANFEVVSLTNWISQLTQLISKGTTVLILYVGALSVVDGSMTMGQLIAFNMLAGRVTAPILRLSQLWQEFQQVRVSLKRLGDLMNRPTEAPLKARGDELPPIVGRVGFNHVNFEYVPGRPTLRDVNLEIDAGSIVGLVGTSGSGKSTLMKLLQGLHHPSTGRVTIDDYDVRSVDPIWLRRQIGVVSQETLLFSQSVRENIALADPSIGMDRIIAAAKLAGAHDFITELAEGYDTVLTEGGASLSGGQRQRIAIARALVNRPRILILDEATSALDVESEKLIVDNLPRIAVGRTVFIIAHRLSTVRTAHRIITLEQGEVVEDGFPDELIVAGGRFAQLSGVSVQNAAAQ